jgi:hypothetical protein
MIHQNITPLDTRLAELERAIRETRRLIRRFQNAEAIHRETALLAPGAAAALAAALQDRAATLRTAWQRAAEVYAAGTPIEE